MRLTWDATGEKLYETGVDRAVVYPMGSDGKYAAGSVWNGLTSYNESPSGAESNPIYADNIKYCNLISAEEFGASLEAYMYPDAFAECDGSVEVAPGVIIGQQKRKAFGFTCRTLIGNDIEGTELGYKLHIVYNAMAAPSEKAYATVNDSPEAITFSWELTTTPVAVTGYKPTASITIDSTKVDAEKLAALEDVLYGTEEAEATLPSPDEVIAMLKAA